MHNTQLFFPLVAMAFWTFVITIYMGRVRVRAVKNKQVDFAYFKINQGEKIPEQMTCVVQHYENLFEINSLFYVVVTLLYVTQQTHLLTILLAWSYFATRIAHSIIHLGSNNVKTRFLSFVLSLVFLITLWIIFLIGIVIGSDSVKLL